MSLQTTTPFIDTTSGALLEALPSAVVVAGPLGDVLYANPAATRLLGPAGARLSVLGAARSSPPWARACAGETVDRETVELERAIKPVVVSMSARPATFAGRSACVVSLHELGERDLELARSERRLTSVFLNTPIAVAIGRFNSGLMLNVNDRFLEFFGYRREEIVGRSINDLDIWVSPEQHARLRAVLASGKSLRAAEVRLRRKDRSVRDALISFDIIEAGDDPVVVVMVTDLTPGKEMRRTLDEVTRRFQLFVETVEEYAIVLLDAEGRMLTWNPAAQRIEGYAENEVLGGEISTFYTEEDRERGVPQKLLATAAESGRSTAQGWRVRKDGTRFWADTVVTALRDAQGTLTGYATIMRDLTDRKKAEEAELLRGREEVQREVVANVSHELRTPIAAIRGFVETLKNGAIKDPRNRGKFVNIIDKHAAHLSRLVEDILNLAALDGGDQGEVESVALAPFVKQALEGLEPLIKRQGLKVRVRVGAEFNARLDPQRLRQVLGNLLANAIKYNAANGRILIEAKRQGEMIELSVSNTGLGIPAAELPLLFERFRRTSAARKGKTKGTGLGLSIAKKIVEGWGGRIWAQSGRSSTTFRFTFPRT